MRIIFACIFCIISVIGFAQQNSKIIFYHFLKDEKLVLNKNYMLQNNDTISIQTLKYYVSAIQLVKNEKVVWKEVNSFHLIDEANEISKQIDLTKMPMNIDFDAVQFYIGIDSTTNYAGVQGGDLDPTKGMYWTWQNGYINFKLEGKSKVCNTRNNVFQFHIGGYENGFATIQKVTLKVTKNEPIIINIDVEKWLSQINLSTQNEIMQPCKEAVEIANKLPLIFSIK